MSRSKKISLRSSARLTLVAVVSAMVMFVVCGGDDDSGKSGGGNYTYTGRTVKIGDLTWMAENLNRNTDNSWCSDNDDSNCARYGRLYTWDAAMNACPAGWRLPDTTEWNNLIVAAGDNYAIKLRATSGWSYNGTDDYGFSALPGGFRSSRGDFINIGTDAYWWSATELSFAGVAVVPREAWYQTMFYRGESMTKSIARKDNGYSVRCVQQ